MELESYDCEPYDYGLEEEQFYETLPPKPSNTRRVTFSKRVFAKVSKLFYNISHLHLDKSIKIASQT